MERLPPNASAFEIWLADCDRLCRRRFGIPSSSRIDATAWRRHYNAGLSPAAALDQTIADEKARVPPPAVRFTLREIRINRGGYDASGAYWGLGDPLYWASPDDGGDDSYFRASTRDAAKDIVRRHYPGARFHR